MDLERFKKLCWKDSMHLQYHEPRTGYIIDCILCAVDFDECMVKIWVVPTEIHDGNHEYWVNADHIELPKLKPRLVVK